MGNPDGPVPSGGERERIIICPKRNNLRLSIPGVLALSVASPSGVCSGGGEGQRRLYGTPIFTCCILLAVDVSDGRLEHRQPLFADTHAETMTAMLWL